MGRDQNTKWVFQVNEWLSCKRLDRIDSIREEVEAWDTSALGPTFQIAKAALLDDLDIAFEEARKALALEAIGEVQLLEWPLLEEMRADERFEALLLDASGRPDVGNVALKRPVQKPSGDGTHRLADHADGGSQ